MYTIYMYTCTCIYMYIYVHMYMYVYVHTTLLNHPHTCVQDKLLNIITLYVWMLYIINITYCCVIMYM